MGRALSSFIALSMALGAVFAGRAQAADSATPPHTIAEATAIAARLANATGAGGHAELALEADRIALIPADWLVACLQPLGDATPVGFAKPYPPETGDPALPNTSSWKVVTSTDKEGAIDLNAAIETKKEVLAYAVATVGMPGGPAEVRIGSPCAVAVWINGRPLMAHEIYHASEAIDQYVATADFRTGTNTVMVKCCQNEQTESWAVEWRFRLRICDPLGKPLATQAEPATPNTTPRKADDARTP